MPNEPFFEFAPYHLLLVLIGAVVLMAYWLPRFVSNREPAAPPLLILFGMLCHWAVPDIALLPDPRSQPLVWERASEITVIVALFATGLRIDSPLTRSLWGPTARMLVLAMPLSIAAVAVMGHSLVGMTVAGSILLGAVLAPTDPVLAADVQVGPPHEGIEHPVRFTLTTEAALNDGLAFPFVYLGLLVAIEGVGIRDWGATWIGIDLLYRTAMGTAAGIVAGWALGKVLFAIPRRAVLADTASGIVALAGVLLCYGATELAEGYGFIAVAVMGLTLRRVESEHVFHRALHDFCETVEHALMALLLVALGGVLPLLFADLNWTHFLIALLLIVVIRPGAAWVSLMGSRLRGRDRLVVAVYGVRGIGSIYYLCYAGSHIEFVNEDQLWSLVGLTILLSTLLHGFTVGRAMDKLDD
ncbi:sodium/proton antiporter (CPA1 family) [Palleronia aestuarii]|uniref:Sodium/proton antiporter (CPA1 family) n=1 Tax=Palleronia aestuarii TaxID=568105 RepID=A0A2W7NAB3_9RHOB|nr:cation:proton antiporter [Palleronia aestuarii]PZX17018.1 sodium/proton antiporter (CPA1 family) [Palleronia aestuarii]